MILVSKMIILLNLPFEESLFPRRKTDVMPKINNDELFNAAKHMADRYAEDNGLSLPDHGVTSIYVTTACIFYGTGYVMQLTFNDQGALKEVSHKLTQSSTPPN